MGARWRKAMARTASLLGRADAALYAAKGAGRNRVSIGLAQATLSDLAVRGTVRGR